MIVNLSEKNTEKSNWITWAKNATDKHNLKVAHFSPLEAFMIMFVWLTKTCITQTYFIGFKVEENK